MVRRQRSFTSRKTKGQGLLEFALVIPVLLLVIFGIIDLGWMVFNFSQLYNAVREATRYGSVSGFVTPPQMERCDDIKATILRNAGFSGVKADQITIWYDDGRSIPNSQTQPSDVPEANIVATCTSASPSTFTTQKDTYQCQTGMTCPPRIANSVWSLINGDRVVIDVNVQVRFLTPFFRAMVPQGITIHMRNARSIFPSGLAS